MNALAKNLKKDFLAAKTSAAKIIENRQGMTLPLILVFGTISMIIVGGIVSWGLLNLRAARQTVQREVAFEIAESGNEYYRWHLAHAPTDYQDGAGEAGPYVHEFYDRSGNLAGRFSLSITAPLTGSTIVTINSSGQSIRDYAGTRTIQTKLAKPSLAKFSVAANDNLRFGAGTIVHGEIQSNGGIHFDGLAYNLVSSAQSTYYDPDYTSESAEFGVYTRVSPQDPYPPNNVPSRTDVFIAGRQFPVPAIDFTGFTADISQMKSDAQTAGFYRANSGGVGYHLVLKNNDTFDLYEIISLRSAPYHCTNESSQSGWGTWSVNNQTFLGNYSFPTNGIIFLEDDIFVDGQINTARLTVVAAVFPDNPSTRKNITVNDNLLYSNFDGQDVISLVAQNNFNVGLYSADNLTIDAAIIAQNGRAGRYYYNPSNCSAYSTRTSLNLNGMIASNQRYGFAYTNNTGYLTRNITYDGNLLYSPPPSFPQTSDQYTIISWQEIK
jgi:hypothetical protein